ncbi:MAG TPA: sulfurtransferase TusA family protein [Oculatellaceae cyanobacterium]
MSLHLDLRGIPCPTNFVKARLFLDKMQSGESVEILLDDGEPFENVTLSVQEEGHKINSSEQSPEGHYKVLIQKA